MSNWSGFSDDDLRKIKNQTPPSEIESPESSPREVHLGKQRTKIRRYMIPNNKSPPITSNKLPKLTPLKAEDISPVNVPSPAPKDKLIDRRSMSKMKPKLPSLPENGELPESDELKTDCTDEISEDTIEKDPTVGISEDLSKIEKFQQQQKLMEELNKQKQRLLFKAINERQKQAAVESQKLRSVQQELSHLDNMLTADVSVMRDRIEAVSIQFLDAQKKYDRVEKEFIAAKMDLYRTAELKEQLTEHLYLMIHQNELRKAEKLSLLMNQMNILDSNGSIEMGVIDLPPLSAFSTYSVSTLPSGKTQTSPIRLVNMSSPLPQPSESPKSPSNGITTVTGTQTAETVMATSPVNESPNTEITDKPSTKQSCDMALAESPCKSLSDKSINEAVSNDRPRIVPENESLANDELPSRTLILKEKSNCAEIAVPINSSDNVHDPSVLTADGQVGVPPGSSVLTT